MEKLYKTFYFCYFNYIEVPHHTHFFISRNSICVNDKNLIIDLKSIFAECQCTFFFKALIRHSSFAAS